jgi:hypothetical protein
LLPRTVPHVPRHRRMLLSAPAAAPARHAAGAAGGRTCMMHARSYAQALTSICRGWGLKGRLQCSKQRCRSCFSTRWLMTLCTLRATRPIIHTLSTAGCGLPGFNRQRQDARLPHPGHRAHAQVHSLTSPLSPTPLSHPSLPPLSPTPLSHPPPGHVTRLGRPLLSPSSS